MYSDNTNNYNTNADTNTDTDTNPSTNPNTGTNGSPTPYVTPVLPNTAPNDAPTRTRQMNTRQYTQPTRAVARNNPSNNPPGISRSNGTYRLALHVGNNTTLEALRPEDGNSPLSPLSPLSPTSDVSRRHNLATPKNPLSPRRNDSELVLKRTQTNQRKRRKDINKVELPQGLFNENDNTKYREIFKMPETEGIVRVVPAVFGYTHGELVVWQNYISFTSHRGNNHEKITIPFIEIIKIVPLPGKRIMIKKHSSELIMTLNITDEEMVKFVLMLNRLWEECIPNSDQFATTEMDILYEQFRAMCMECNKEDEVTVEGFKKILGPHISDNLSFKIYLLFKLNIQKHSISFTDFIKGLGISLKGDLSQKIQACFPLSQDSDGAYWIIRRTIKDQEMLEIFDKIDENKTGTKISTDDVMKHVNWLKENYGIDPRRKSKSIEKEITIGNPKWNLVLTMLKGIKYTVTAAIKGSATTEVEGYQLIFSTQPVSEFLKAILTEPDAQKRNPGLEKFQDLISNYPLWPKGPPVAEPQAPVERVRAKRSLSTPSRHTTESEDDLHKRAPIEKEKGPQPLNPLLKRKSTEALIQYIPPELIKKDSRRHSLRNLPLAQPLDMSSSSPAMNISTELSMFNPSPLSPRTVNTAPSFTFGYITSPAPNSTPTFHPVASRNGSLGSGSRSGSGTKAQGQPNQDASASTFDFSMKPIAPRLNYGITHINFEEMFTVTFTGKNPNTPVLFRSYCPKVFLALLNHFKITTTSFMASHRPKSEADLYLGTLSLVRNVISTAKSGAFFFKTLDDRYLVKTIPNIEALTFLRRLPSYFNYVTENSNTLLLRILGFFRLEKKNKIVFFLVMENVFYGKHQITEQYDMKGSTVGRSTNLTSPTSEFAMKDLDFLKFQGSLALGTELRQLLLNQIEKDGKWLESHKLLDYSLLVGICRNQEPEAKEDISVFKSDGGGLRTGNMVVYFGIIDILTKYNMKKKAEHYIIGALSSDRNQISAIPPDRYRMRFVEFFSNIFV